MGSSQGRFNIFNTVDCFKNHYIGDKMRLYSVEMENYKLFHKMIIPFNGKSTVLFGVNGTGKSTVLSAINFIFRVFINQMNPVQSKAFEKLTDEMISVGEKYLHIRADVQLDDVYLLSRRYVRSPRNQRNNEMTYPKINYMIFKQKFTDMYMQDDKIGMPIFVYYGTNRAVFDIPDRIKEDHRFDKLSAIERAIDLKLDFKSFFEWFRETEAEEIISARDAVNYDYVDPALSHVRKAIENMIGNVSGLRVKRSPVRMVVDKAGKEVRVDMLSDGEKCTLALLGDLARRLILANPSADNPLEGDGIVLIDEIELHMHPSWQRRILHVLKSTFPNIQFIVTTHSPQVLGEAGDDYNIISLKYDEAEDMVVPAFINRMDGLDSNMILEEYMDTASESETKKSIVKGINEAIRKENFSEAEEKLKQLSLISGEDDEQYILSRGYLERMKHR